MSKTIEFKVSVFQVGIGNTKTKIYYAKNLDRLIASFPKSIKKKWKSITYVENGKTKTITND